MTAEPMDAEDALWEPSDEDDDPSMSPDPYRDGKVHVMSEKCSTCVFRPGNIMHLPPGRLKALTDHAQETGVPFSCHQTLPYASKEHSEYYGGSALCAGAVENYGDSSPFVLLARDWDVIEPVQPYPGKEEDK